jgi:hypothetical protein
MDLSVTCECGLKNTVTPTMCGSDITCDCGKTILIPRLSELRRNAGLAPVNISVADHLVALAARGELPTETVCVSCSRSTNMYLALEVECERTFAKKMSAAYYFLTSFFSPLYLLVFLKREYDNPEVHGRELVVRTPIRICEVCAAKTRLDRETCRNLMSKNNLYAKLLTRYPNASIAWDDALKCSST